MSRVDDILNRIEALEKELRDELRTIEPRIFLAEATGHVALWKRRSAANVPCATTSGCKNKRSAVRLPCIKQREA